jgi:hypothetical protein
MLVRDHGDGGRWYVVTVHYPTAVQAKGAWERCERKLDLSLGDQGIGITRLAPNPSTRTRSTGVPEGAHAVAAVTLHESTARKAERLLRDGTPWRPRDDFADALILRRAQVVAEHAGETGRLIIRRPEGRGAALGAMGDLREQEPGRG